MTNDIQRHAVILSLRKAFGGEWFDICGVIDACGVAGIKQHDHACWPLLRALHCKRWVDIGAHRAEMVRLVAEIFGYDVDGLALNAGAGADQCDA